MPLDPADFDGCPPVCDWCTEPADIVIERVPMCNECVGLKQMRDNSYPGEYEAGPDPRDCDTPTEIELRDLIVSDEPTGGEGSPQWN